MTDIAKKKILIVDDEPTVIKLLSKLLNEHYAVIKARNGEEAIKIAVALQPDLILMDLMMPKMDGYQCCHAIKSDPKTSMIPVIMLTAVHQSLNVKLGEIMGADGYLTKPFNTEELLDTIAEFVAGDQTEGP